jgi:hypothetical protein
MEIKTTIQIIKDGLGNEINAIEIDAKCLSFKNKYLETEWISVDELIEELEDLHEMRRLELIKELKGEQK